MNPKLALWVLAILAALLALFGIINKVQADKFRKETEAYEQKTAKLRSKIADLQVEIASKQHIIQLAKMRIARLENKQDTLKIYETKIEKQIENLLMRPTPTLEDNFEFFSGLDTKADTLRGQ